MCRKLLQNMPLLKNKKEKKWTDNFHCNVNSQLCSKRPAYLFQIYMRKGNIMQLWSDDWENKESIGFRKRMIGVLFLGGQKVHFVF